MSTITSHWNIICNYFQLIRRIQSVSGYALYQIEDFHIVKIVEEEEEATVKLTCISFNIVLHYPTLYPTVISGF